MDAAPFLHRVAELLTRYGLDAVMVGNAAAALQGTPVTTIDIDFLFRKTPANLKKLKAISKDLDAVILTPYYPVSGLYRISRDDGLQLDFMTAIDGVRSFEGLRSRAQAVSFGACKIAVASLTDIIKSKKAAGRPKDLAVLEILEKALEESAGHSKGEVGSSSEGE